MTGIVSGWEGGRAYVRGTRNYVYVKTGENRVNRPNHKISGVHTQGVTSKLTGCSSRVQQPAAANLYSESNASLLDTAASWLQPMVFLVLKIDCCSCFHLAIKINCVLWEKTVFKKELKLLKDRR